MLSQSTVSTRQDLLLGLGMAKRLMKRAVVGSRMVTGSPFITRRRRSRLMGRNVLEFVSRTVKQSVCRANASIAAKRYSKFSRKSIVPKKFPMSVRHPSYPIVIRWVARSSSPCPAYARTSKDGRALEDACILMMDALVPGA